MYDLVEACLFEAYDLRTKAAAGKAGATLAARTAGARSAVRSKVSSAGETNAGAKVGEQARKLSTFMSKLPLITLAPDAISSAYCVDLLNAKWMASPADPVAAVQLAEALIAAQQAQSIVRMARVADPTAYLLSSSIRTTSGFGRGAKLPTPSRLARRSHRAVLAVRGPSEVDHHLALARAYRISGKPGLATRYAVTAGGLAAKQLATLGPPPAVSFQLGAAMATGGWKAAARALGTATSAAADRINDRIERLEAGWTGEVKALDPRTRSGLQVGAAWTTFAWALRDAGDSAAARQAAESAVANGFTCGYEVLAALVGTDGGSLTDRIGERAALLSKVTREDRTFYRGRWRGSLWTTGAAVNQQARKTSRLGQLRWNSQQ